MIKIQNIKKDNDLLVTAKEFIKGEKGDPGKDGYTPVKGVDYFDGEPFTYEDFTAEQLAALKGKDGKDGKDGFTPVKGVDYFDGADGAPGKSGVHVGTEEPEDEEIVVWIDTAGESDELEAAEGSRY